MKITKLSLATIIALGSISFANAQNLEDAIKNVETSGTVAYRYNDYEENNDAKNDDSSTSNNYKIAINLNSKVNDDVKFNSRFIAGNKTDAGNVGLDSQANGDGNVDVFLSEVNFVYTGVKNSTFTVGKQALTTPFTVARDAMGNEQTGTGLLAMTTAGPVTLAAGYFNQTNLGQSGGVIKDGSTFIYNDINKNGVWDAATEPTIGSSNDGKISSKDVATVGAIVTLGPVTADAWYIDLQDVLDAYTLGVTADLNLNELKLNPYARYSALNLDSSSDDNSLWKVGMDAQMGIFGAYLAYGQTNEEGGIVDLDGSATTGMDDHWRVTLSGISDASAIYASVNTQVTDTVNVALKYSGIDTGSKSNSEDQSEVYAQVAYKMSKNLSTYARFGQYEVDNFYGANDDLQSLMGRLHVQYSF